jgi:multidrug efflux system membrane fusion protein
MKKIIFVTVLCALLGGCSKPPAVEEPVRAVKVLTVGAGLLVSGSEFAGEVRAQVESRLGFRVAGKIIARQASLGQYVKAGQVLAQLDPQDYQLAVDAARAQVTAAQSVRDLALADFRRYQDLRAQNFISSAELERREVNLKSAQAQLDQAQSLLAAQSNQVAYARLVADIDGVVTAVEAEVGQVVMAGTPVFKIAADGARDVVFSLPEDRLSAIKLGQTAQARVWPNDSTLEGKVREVAASADPVTRTYQVKLALKPGQAVPQLGATVTVMASGWGGSGLQGQPVIKLPTSALRKEGAGTAVWVLEPASMTVRSQAVQIATADGNEAVVASGLVAGMQVVSAGVHVLSPGQKVVLYAAAAEKPALTPDSAGSPASLPASPASNPAK